MYSLLFYGLIITEYFNRQKDVDSKKIYASKSYSSEVFLKVRYANLYLQKLAILNLFSDECFDFVLIDSI
jgi:hypothetical protein